MNEKKQYRNAIGSLGPLFHIPIWLAFTLLSIWLLYGAVFVTTNQPLWSRIGVSSMLLWFLWFLIFKLGRSFFTTADYVWVDDHELSFKRMFDARPSKPITYEKIDRIYCKRDEVGARISTSDNPPVEFGFSGSIYLFGELVEFLCEKAVNATEINLDNILNFPRWRDRYWQKEVNYEIMNRAKARAEENRKKMENLTA